MPPLSTYLRPLPVVRRAYSVYTKAGGGRFFNAAKPLTQAGNTSKPEVDASAASNAEPTSSVGVVKETNSTPSTASMPSEAKSSILSSLGINFAPSPIHPQVNSHDLKLHQFLSLHRPLLTISQPTSSIFESSPSPFSFPPTVNADTAKYGTIDDPPEASPESDADAARLLARALVTSKVSAALAWEDTLRRLGLDETKGRAEEVVQAQAELDMYMDSTKRKRRKKMKKHK